MNDNLQDDEKCFYKALDFEKENDIINAIKQYEKAIEINSNFLDAHCNLGALYQQQKDYDKAITHYNKAITIDPNDCFAYHNLASTYQILRDFDKALQYAYRTFEIDANDIEVICNLALCLCATNQSKKAITLISSIPKPFPNHLDYKGCLGWIYLRDKQYQKAELHLLEAWKLWELDNQMYYAVPMNLGNLY